MTATPSKGVVAQRVSTAARVREMRDGPGLTFAVIARQLGLSDSSNAQRFYRESVLRDVKRYWFKLPMAIRDEWWAETNYGEKKPTMGLTNKLAIALKGIKQCTS